MYTAFTVYKQRLHITSCVLLLSKSALSGIHTKVIKVSIIRNTYLSHQRQHNPEYILKSSTLEQSRSHAKINVSMIQKTRLNQRWHNPEGMLKSTLA